MEHKINVQAEILKYCADEAHTITEIFTHITSLNSDWKDTKYGRDVLRQNVYRMVGDGLLWSSGKTAHAPFYRTTEVGRKVLEAMQS